MKQFFIHIIILSLSLHAMTQEYDSWKIFHNRKEVARFSEKEQKQDERKVVLLNRLLNSKGLFIIEVEAAAAQARWLRTIAIYDKDENPVREFSNTGELRMQNEDLKAIMEKYEKVKIFTWAIPDDPQLAAVVRVKRILLCILYTR